MEKQSDTRHPVDRPLPPGRLAALGFQHVLIMYTGCVAVPLVFGSAAKLDKETIGILINADLLVAGIITLIQSLGIGKILGVRLPVVTGATFAALTPMILIAGEYGMPAVYGSMLASGLFGLLVAVPFAKVVRFIPPLVSGVIITVVGFSLIGVAAKLIVGNDPEAKGYADPQNLALSAGIILTIVVFNRFARGFLKQTGVLVALVGGTLVAIPMGLTDFSSVSGSDWVGVSTPFHFGAPEFPPAAVISMCVVMLVIFTESTASMLAVAEMTEKPLKNADLARGLAADGLSGVIGGAMNGLPDTLFGQNIGLVGMSGIRSRYVTATAGGILVLLGLVPKMGEFVACLPGPVIGSAGLVMFGMVAAIGVDTLRKVDLSDGNNLMIAAVSLGVGMLPVAQPTMYDKFPDWVHIIAGSAITSAAVMAFCLNLLFNHMPWGRSEEPVALPDLTTDPGEKAAKQPA